uniref:F-box domain-containing protein n=1 Tax=Steinernema glaseri TaxID=37863 RepID=A0A1I8AF82_9BILA
MESVPIAFVDTLCAKLKKEDLEELKQIGRPWSRTVMTHFSRRREFRVSLQVHPEGTEVLFDVRQIGFRSSVNLESFAWSKYDRFRHIQMDKFDRFGAQPLKMPLERFLTKFLPVLTSLADDYVFHMTSWRRYPQNFTDTLFSSLRGRALEIKTRYAGGKGVEFIERQIRIGRLEHLEIEGTEWPDSMEASLKSFLKSPNFVKLYLEETNLTVDLDMLACIVQRFFKGELPKSARLEGKPSEEMRDLHDKSLCGETLPLLDGLTTRPETFRINKNMIFWSGPGPKKLFVSFGCGYSVRIYCVEV